MQPSAIKLKKADNLLLVTFPQVEINLAEGASKTDTNHTEYALSAEYLRVMSPSAEVRGHSPDQATLQVGKKYVRLVNIEAVGHYAIKLVFDDGHDSGLYTWEYLYDLASNEQTHWQTYEDALTKNNKSRDPHESVVQFIG